LPPALGPVFRTTGWRRVVANPGAQIMAGLAGGATVAAQIIAAAIEHRKPAVTANKELMAGSGLEILDLAMEAIVHSGIPIHALLREGVSVDRVMEERNVPPATALEAAQRLGYAEAPPSAGVDGFDARTKLAPMAALPSDSVHTGLLPVSTILAGVQAAHNAAWVKGTSGEDTFDCGWGAGALPISVAVVSDPMRVAREILYQPGPVMLQVRACFLRFRVENRRGIVAKLAVIPAGQRIGLQAVRKRHYETRWRRYPVRLSERGALALPMGMAV
jgi:homoserine dehydrogenase